jgi:hypothetical protein
MNKRIQELAIESAKYADYYAMLSGVKEKEIFTEKFADLIILECAKIVATAVEHREPASTYVSKILELRNETSKAD